LGFAIFVPTVLAFAAVVVTFVRWVDRIARLGRMVNTIGQVENAATDAPERRRRSLALDGLPASVDSAGSKGILVRSRSGRWWLPWWRGRVGGEASRPNLLRSCYAIAIWAKKGPSGMR